MTPSKLAPVKRYVAEVTILGGAVAACSMTGLPSELGRTTPAIGLLMCLVVLGEAYPIPVRIREESENVTTSTAFMLAVLVLAGPALAIISQVLASVLSDIRARKEWWKALFNGAQYAVAIAAAAALGRVVAPSHGAVNLPSFDARDMAA